MRRILNNTAKADNAAILMIISGCIRLNKAQLHMLCFPSLPIVHSWKSNIRISRTISSDLCVLSKAARITLSSIFCWISNTELHLTWVSHDPRISPRFMSLFSAERGWLINEEKNGNKAWGKCGHDWKRQDDVKLRVINFRTKGFNDEKRGRFFCALKFTAQRMFGRW